MFFLLLEYRNLSFFLTSSSIPGGATYCQPKIWEEPALGSAATGYFFTWLGVIFKGKESEDENPLMLEKECDCRCFFIAR